ncbi:MULTISPECIES: transposase [unclassified Streptomyces]|uniref:transposase n=1 Tax=unclassified Streptomyces TaxID=2593676 RepID=UPI00381F9055
MATFGRVDRLAAFAGVAPAARDSGRISGNLHRPHRYSRLQRVFCTSALISIRCCPASRCFYDRKRAEGKRHVQAVLALARRRVNVLGLCCETGATTARPPRHCGPGVAGAAGHGHRRRDPSVTSFVGGNPVQGVNVPDRMANPARRSPSQINVVSVPDIRPHSTGRSCSADTESVATGTAKSPSRHAERGTR